MRGQSVLQQERLRPEEADQQATRQGAQAGLREVCPGIGILREERSFV